MERFGALVTRRLGLAFIPINKMSPASRNDRPVAFVCLLLVLFACVVGCLTSRRLQARRQSYSLLGRWTECRLLGVADSTEAPTSFASPTRVAILFIVRDDLYFAEQWMRWINLCSDISIFPFIHSASGRSCKHALSTIQDLVQVPTVSSEWCHISEVMGALLRRAAKTRMAEGCLFASESCAPCSGADVFRDLDLRTSRFFLPHDDGDKASMWCYMTRDFMDATASIAAFPRDGITLRGRTRRWGNACSEEHVWLAVARAFRLPIANVPVTFECWDASRLDAHLSQLDMTTVESGEAAHHPCTFEELSLPFLKALRRSRYVFVRKVAPNPHNARVLDLFLSGVETGSP